MTPIEVGWTIVGPPVELIARNCKQLVDRAAGIVVVRLPVSVSTQKLQATTEPLGDAHLQRVVVGIRAGLHLLNAARNVLLRRQRGTERSHERIRRAIVNRLIERDYLKQLRSLRTDIADFEQIVFCKLPLHVRVVLVNVRRPQLRIDEDAADWHTDNRREWRERRRNRRIHRKLSWLRYRNKRIRHRPQHARQSDSERQIRIVEQLRVCVACRETVVIDSVTAASDERAAIVQSIRETGAWCKVVLVSRDECVFYCRYTRECSVTCLHESIWWTSRRRIRTLAELIGQEVDETAACIDRVAVEVVT